MTEDQAREKWCPFARLSINSEMSWDNRGNDYHDPYCIASDCMAWRRTYSTDELFTDDDGNICVRTLAGSIGGYCGLAGKP